MYFCADVYWTNAPDYRWKLRCEEIWTAPLTSRFVCVCVTWLPSVVRKPHACASTNIFERARCKRETECVHTHVRPTDHQTIIEIIFKSRTERAKFFNWTEDNSFFPLTVILVSFVFGNLQWKKSPKKQMKRKQFRKFYLWLKHESCGHGSPSDSAAVQFVWKSRTSTDSITLADRISENRDRITWYFFWLSNCFISNCFNCCVCRQQ